MKTISIVIPVYNEEERLPKTFEALRELRLLRGLKLEKVIFVDDGSRDGTKQLINRFINSSTVGGVTLVVDSSTPGESLRATPGVSSGRSVLIAYSKNMGKGYAISQGMKASESDYTLFCDADMSTPLGELEKFMPHMGNGAPVIIGTRKNSHSTVVAHQPFYREVLGRGFTFISNCLLDTDITDFTCGFKAFSKEAKDIIFPKIKVKGWGFDAEVIFLAKLYGLETVEVPVIWSDDKRSKVNLLTDLPVSLYELMTIRSSRLLRTFGGVTARASHLPATVRGVLPKFSPKPAFSFLRTIKSLLF